MGLILLSLSSLEWRRDILECLYPSIFFDHIFTTSTNSSHKSTKSQGGVYFIFNFNKRHLKNHRTTFF